MCVSSDSAAAVSRTRTTLSPALGDVELGYDASAYDADLRTDEPELRGGEEPEGAPSLVGSACPALFGCLGRLVCLQRFLRGGTRRPLLANTVSSTWAGGGDAVDDADEGARTARKRRGASMGASYCSSLSQPAVSESHETVETRRGRYE